MNAFETFMKYRTEEDRRRKLDEMFHSMTGGLPSFVDSILSWKCLGIARCGREHIQTRIRLLNGATCKYDILWRGHRKDNCYAVSECEGGPAMQWNGEAWVDYVECDHAVFQKPVEEPETQPEYRLAAEVAEDGQMQIEFESRAIEGLDLGESEPIQELVI